jgi:hypothetical protein
MAMEEQQELLRQSLPLDMYDYIISKCVVAN